MKEWEGPEENWVFRHTGRNETVIGGLKGVLSILSTSKSDIKRLSKLETPAFFSRQ